MDLLRREQGPGPLLISMCIRPWSHASINWHILMYRNIGFVFVKMLEYMTFGLTNIKKEIMISKIARLIQIKSFFGRNFVYFLFFVLSLRFSLSSMGISILSLSPLTRPSLSPLALNHQ